MIGQWQKYYPLAVALALVVLVNMAAGYYHTKIDLTEEKRFTMTDATEQLLAELDAPIFIQVLLAGDFPAAGFKRLQTAAQETLRQFRKNSPMVTYRFEDPMHGSAEEVRERLEYWAGVGMVPTELTVKDAEGQSRRQIYPYAIFNYGDRQVAINLLERETRGVPAEVTLNNSIGLLEYKFANAIAKLRAEQKPTVLFSTGHGELTAQQTASLAGNLRAFYQTASIDLDSVYQIPPEIDLLIVAKPTEPFGEKPLFVLDQYLMNGGRLVFLLDPLVVNLDSIRRHGQYVPHKRALGLDEMLFRYGCRVLPNLVLDLECSQIPLAVDRGGGKSGFELFPWPYHVIAAGVPDHPITKSLDRINLQFPASIDTVKTKTLIKKTPLLMSSRYSRMQVSPVLLDFDMVRDLDDAQFTGPSQTLALLLEGAFPSVYANRVPADFRRALEQIGSAFRPEGDPSKILVVADGDIAKNLVDPISGDVSDVGYNQYLQYTFANKNFLTNAIEYMLDQDGLMEARSKNIRLRLLDKPRIARERVQWQLLNVALPLLLLVLFGWIFQLRRRRKYGRPAA